MTNTMTPTNRPAAAQLCDIIVRKDATIVSLTKQLKIATEALESVNVDASALCRSAIDAPEAVYEIGLTATQALARIKEAA